MAKIQQLGDMYLMEIAENYQQWVTMNTLDNMITKALADGNRELAEKLMQHKRDILNLPG